MVLRRYTRVKPNNNGGGGGAKSLPVAVAQPLKNTTEAAVAKPFSPYFDGLVRQVQGGWLSPCVVVVVALAAPLTRFSREC